MHAPPRLNRELGLLDKAENCIKDAAQSWGTGALIYRFTDIDVPAALAPRIPTWVGQPGAAFLLLTFVIAAPLAIDTTVPGTAAFAMCFHQHDARYRQVQPPDHFQQDGRQPGLSSQPPAL